MKSKTTSATTFKILFSRLLYCIIIFTSFIMDARAQVVNANLIITPPYSVYFRDYSGYGKTNNILLSVISNTNRKVYLAGSVTKDDNSIVISVKNGYRPLVPIFITANMPLMLNGVQLRNIFGDGTTDDLNLTGLSAKDIGLNQALPEGSYKFCIEVKDYDTKEVISTACKTIFVTYSDPPQIINPFNGKPVPAFDPQMLMVTWQNTAPMVFDVKYRIKMVKLIKGITALDALNNNVQLILDKGNLTTTNYPLDVASGIKLETGQSYAMQVIASSPTAYFKNGGKSEVTLFTYTAISNYSKKETQKEETKFITGQTIKFTPDKEPKKLNQNVFKGKLVWAFAKTEIVANKMSNESINDGTNILVKNGNYWDLDSYNGEYIATGSTLSNKQNPQNNQGSPSNFTSYGGGATFAYNSVSNAGFTSNADITGQVSLLTPQEKSMLEQKKKQEKIISLADNKHYPLANTNIKVYANVLVMGKNDFGKPDPSQKKLVSKLIGTGKTKSNGEFVINYSGDDIGGFAQSVELEIQTPYFQFANYFIPINKNENGTYDLGELLGLASTLRIKVKVTDEDNLPLNTASVEILRPGGFYEQNPLYKNLTHEVMNDELNQGATQSKKPREITNDDQQADKNAGKTFGEKDYLAIIVGEGKSGAVFKKAFINDNLNDKYLIRIKAENAKIKTYEFIATGYTGDVTNGDIITIEKVYKVSMNNPSVKGRVLVKKGELPVHNATVLVIPQKNENISSQKLIEMKKGGKKDAYYTATTNKLGKFSIDNIPVSVDPYSLRVLYNSSEYKDENKLILASKGIIQNRDPIYVNAVLIKVCGVIQDVKGKPLPNALLHWKEGGKNFISNSKGSFLTSQTIGKHIIVAQLPGFKDTEMEIDVTGTNSNSAFIYDPKNTTTTIANNWATIPITTIIDQPSGSASSGNQGTVPIGSYMGADNLTQFNNGVTVENAVMGSIYNAGDIVSNDISCGHIIQMKSYLVKTTVIDAVTKKPIAKAVVQSEDDEKESITDASGVAMVKNVSYPSGAIIVKGPDNTMYVPVKKSVAINNSKDITEITVSLKMGARLSGKVLLKGAPVKDAEVAVVGMEFINTTSNADGSYELWGVPASAGEYKFRGSKIGLLAHDISIVTQTNKAYVADFLLTDPGFDASTLLGFKMVLNNSVKVSETEFKISGYLFDLPDNSVFKKKNAKTQVAFTDQLVVKSGTKVIPKTGQLTTDETEILLKAFDWIQIKLSNSKLLKVKALEGDNTKGQIIGDVVFDVPGTFSALSNWDVPASAVKLKSGNDVQFGAITSDGKLKNPTFNLSGETEGWNVYDIKFKPDLAASVVNNSGLSFKGSLEATGIAGLDKLSLKLKNLHITTAGQVDEVSLSLDPKPSFNLATFKLSLDAASVDAYGFKFSGNMVVPITASPAGQTIGFTDISVSSSTGINGGKFFLPEAGLNIFEVATFTSTGSDAISFQKLPSSTSYQITGSGNMKLKQYIDEELKLDNFTIRTDGNFSAIAQTDYEVDFAGMAKFKIDKVGISTKPAGFDIGGMFSLDIPNLGVAAGGTIHYLKGQTPKVDDLKIGFNLAGVIAMSANVAYSKNKFAGGGELSLEGVGVGLNFSYEKVEGGKNIEASFNLGKTVTIPIGIVKLDNLGGGFKYHSAEKIYSINANGRVTFAADAAGLLALDPVSLTITSKPKGIIFEGSADVVIGGSWNIAKATMYLDFGQKQFYIDGNFDAGFNIIKGISIQNDAKVHIEANANAGDGYWMFAGTSLVSIPYITQSVTQIVGGWNVPKTTHETLSGLPDFMLVNGRLYGGYFSTSAGIDISPPPIDFFLGTISAWYKNIGTAQVFGNVKSNSYGIKYEQNWSAGGKIHINKVGDIASADIKVSGALEGFYSGNNYGFNGNLAATLNGHIGCDGGCNGITWGGCFESCALVPCAVCPYDDCYHETCPIPCGGKVCLSGKVNIGYSASSGFSFNLNIL